MEASHRYQYALKKVNNVINDPITTGAPLSSEHLCTFTQLKTNFLLNHSRCKRKLNVSYFIYLSCFVVAASTYLSIFYFRNLKSL